MNATSDLNSTPKPIDQSRFLESLTDFSTPMSTMPNRSSTTNVSNHSHATLLDKLLGKFHEHQTSFHQTQKHLNLLDHHLTEITSVLEQLHKSLDEHSSLKNTTEQLEIRLLQMSTKREQIRNVIHHFHQSPIPNRNLDETIRQVNSSYVSPSTCQYTDSYIELINAIKLSFNQKSTLLEGLQRRTTGSHLQMQQRQQTLLQLIEKLLEQQKMHEQFTHLPKPQFEQHTRQLNEFNRLHEEYQLLKNETRQLKQMAKENINRLYHFINETTE